MMLLTRNGMNSDSSVKLAHNLSTVCFHDCHRHRRDGRLESMICYMYSVCHH
jgi:hypothetical protein